MAVQQAIPVIRTTVTQDFVIPAAGADVVVEVGNSSIFWKDQVIFVADYGAPHADPNGVGTWFRIMSGNPPVQNE